MKSINQKINIENNLNIGKLLKGNRTVLINETSVYKEYAILKNGSLTPNGHFDLIQIPGLRVYSGKLLKSTRIKLNLTQKELSKKYKVSRFALYQWEHDRAAMPLRTLIKIARNSGITKEKIYKFLKEKRISTKNKINLPLKYEDIVEILPFISLRGKDDLIIKRNSKKHIKKISDLFNIKIYYSSNKQFVINSKDLHNFFVTFLKLGGFIDGVKISKSSKYYEGINKQGLLYATLEYMVRERKDSSLRKLSLGVVHRMIRGIAENNDYKNLNYYTSFFSQNDKVQKCLNY